jgi:hypothetical protein
LGRLYYACTVEGRGSRETRDRRGGIVAATASSKSRQPAITLPEWAYDIKIPIRAVLEEYNNANWRWRMAARKMMARENVISLSAIQTLFNKFFRRGHRFFSDSYLTWRLTELTKSFLMMFILGLSTSPDGLKSKTFPDQLEGPNSHQVNPMMMSALVLM